MVVHFILLLTACLLQLVLVFVAVAACFWSRKQANNNPFNGGWPSQYKRTTIRPNKEGKEEKETVVKKEEV
jgi:hypothetical protein